MDVQRQADGKRGHQDDQRLAQMRQQLVEDEQATGAFERPKVAWIVQVERNVRPAVVAHVSAVGPQRCSQSGALSQEAECQWHEEEEVGS